MENYSNLLSKKITDIALSFKDLKKESICEVQKHKDFFELLYFNTEVDPSKTVSLSELNKDGFLGSFISSLETLRRTYSASNGNIKEHLNPIEEALHSLAFKGNLEADIHTVCKNLNLIKNLESNNHF